MATIAVINRAEQDAWQERVNSLKETVSQLEQNPPQPWQLQQHPEGEAPLEIAPGVFCMAGDYFDADKKVVVPANAVGEGKQFEPVK